MLLQGNVIFRSIGALYGWGLASSIEKPFSPSSVSSTYSSRFWLAQSALIVGERGSAPIDWLVGSRGHLVAPDMKMRIYSASKMVSATVIYAVVDDPQTSLEVNSTPGDFLPWWRCDDADDARCSVALTLEKMLAFRAGLPAAGCEDGLVPAGVSNGEAWEACARRLHGMPASEWAAPPAFDTFEYGSIGLMLAGLMAVEARRLVPGHAADTWPVLLGDYLIAPAGILDAPDYDRNYFTDGAFAYDYSHGIPPAPEFPGLGWGLGCSPRQYATFLSALLSGQLVRSATLAEMTRSHGSTDGFGAGMPFLAGYAQGMWHGPDGFTNSLGFQGFFPWLDQTDADPARHVFGVFAQDVEPAYAHNMMLGQAIGIPLAIVVLVLSCGWLCRERRRPALPTTSGKASAPRRPEL